MSNDGDALYQAICRNPDDDTARLVYADWLDETEIPENQTRAEFIRLSVAKEKPPTESTFVSLAKAHTDSKRADELLKENYDKWTKLACPLKGKHDSICKYCYETGNLFMTGIEAGRIHDSVTVDVHMRGVTYHRGFPVGITCRIAELINESHTFINVPKFSSWARYMVMHTPIIMFKPLEYRPDHQVIRSDLENPSRLRPGAYHKDIYIWREGTGDGPGPTVYLPSWLSNLVWEFAEHYPTVIRKSNSPGAIVCESRDQAYELVARVLGREIRKQAYGKVGTV